MVGVSGQYGRSGTDGGVRRRHGPARSGSLDVTGPGWEGRFRAATPDGVPLQRDLAAERAAAASARATRGDTAAGRSTPRRWWTRSASLLIFGTGNPSPQMADASRPGDNLYTSSLVALDLRTGRLVWHYQQVPHDRWGYDVASSPVLLDVAMRGRTCARGGAGREDRLGVRARPARTASCCSSRSAFVPQRNLFTPPQPGDGRRDRARDRRRRQLVAVRVRSGARAVLRRRRSTCRPVTSRTRPAGPTAACCSTPAPRTSTRRGAR